MLRFRMSFSTEMVDLTRPEKSIGVEAGTQFHFNCNHFYQQFSAIQTEICGCVNVQCKGISFNVADPSKWTDGSWNARAEHDAIYHISLIDFKLIWSLSFHPTHIEWNSKENTISKEREYWVIIDDSFFSCKLSSTSGFWRLEISPECIQTGVFFLLENRIRARNAYKTLRRKNVKNVPTE